MSNDNFYSEDNDPHSEEFSAKPKKGMSKGVKILLILLGIGGVCMLLCCGGGIYIAQQAEIKVTEKKEEIIEIQNDIADITIPDSFKPIAGISFNFFIKMFTVVYEQDSKQGAMFLMCINTPDDGMVNMENQFRTNLKNQKQNARDLKITKQESREFTIRGKKVDFNFAEGTDQNDKKFNQVTGVFPGKSGPSFLLLQIQSEDYNEAEIVKMIESIK